MSKKIFLFSMIAFLFYSASAQDSCDYNPYQHGREEYIQTGREMYEELIGRKCNPDYVKELLDKYSATLPDKTKKEIIQNVSYNNCPEVIAFLDTVFRSDSSEEVRCKAIQCLGFRRPAEFIPVFLEYVKKPSTTEKEKIAISKFLCVLEKFDLAIELLNQFCFDENGNVKESCIASYEHAGEVEVVKKYYESFISTLDTMQEDKKITIAYKLAQYGVYAPSRQILIDALNDCKNQEKMRAALFGLASIGDEDAFKVIKEQTHNKNLVVANEARFILNFIEKERKVKCK